MSCLFCKIADGSVPTQAIFQDQDCYAFPDMRPQAPVHFLVMPRRHIESLADAASEDATLLGKLMWAAAEAARAQGLEEGYRLVVNTGSDGGQTVGHLHIHVLGGRSMTWPPG